MPTNNAVSAKAEPVAVVRAEGEVDRAGLEACDYVLSGVSGRTAVVDLSQATYVDFKAVGILVARRRVLKAKGGELAIAAGAEKVRHMLRVSAGNDVQVFPTVDEATAYVRGEGVVVGASARKALQKKG